MLLNNLLVVQPISCSVIIVNQTKHSNQQSNYISNYILNYVIYYLQLFPLPYLKQLFVTLFIELNQRLIWFCCATLSSQHCFSMLCFFSLDSLSDFPTQALSISQIPQMSHPCLSEVKIYFALQALKLQRSFESIQLTAFFFIAFYFYFSFWQLLYCHYKIVLFTFLASFI